MSLRGLPIRALERRRLGRSAPDEAARRAQRARDHLERKRARERRRRERERLRAEHGDPHVWLRGVLAPLVFGLALGFGLVSARPVAERVLLRKTPLLEVSVQGADALGARQISRALDLRPGLPLARIEPTELRRRLEADPWIESARVLRLPTGTLVVGLVERDAIARWRTGSEGGLELVDPSGVRFAGSPEPAGALPLVRGARADGVLPGEALEILDQLERHASLARDPAAVTLHLPGPEASTPEGPAGVRSGYVLQVGEQGPRALLGRRLLVERVARLASLLEEQEPTLRDARWIDLRYADRAVLRTEPASG